MAILNNDHRFTDLKVLSALIQPRHLMDEIILNLAV
jgi:hypothetical protein